MSKATMITAKMMSLLLLFCDSFLSLSCRGEASFFLLQTNVDDPC